MTNPTLSQQVSSLQKEIERERQLRQDAEKRAGALHLRVQTYEQNMAGESDDMLIHRVASSIQGALGSAILTELTGFSSPLKKIVERVVERRTAQLEPVVDQAVSQLIASDEMKNQIVDAARHKLARLVISDIEGQIERAVVAFRADPVRRARAIAAVERVIAGFDEVRSDI